MLFWNRVYSHRMPSTVTRDPYSGSSRPQEDNAGSPASGTSRLITTAHLRRTTLSLSTPVDTFPAPSLPVSSSVPITQNTIIKIRWKNYQDH